MNRFELVLAFQVYGAVFSDWRWFIHAAHIRSFFGVGKLTDMLGARLLGVELILRIIR